MNPTYPSLTIIRDSNNDKKGDERIIHIPYKRCKNQPLIKKIEPVKYNFKIPLYLCTQKSKP